MTSADQTSRAECFRAPSLREWLAAAANVGLSVTLCLAGVWFGYVLGAAINR